MKKAVSRIYVALIFIILYAPIAVLIVYSFNDSRSRMVWGGFTLKWYQSLFANAEIMEALSTTLLLALAAAGIATILGTAACLGLSKMKKRSRSFILGISNIPMLNGDIVTGIALMLLFVRTIGVGFESVLIAHITFCLPYVILNVMPKFRQMSPNTYEAALDLGASPTRAFFSIILPEIMPGILSGFLLAFTMSLDDFAITYFTKSPGVNTLSTLIYGEIRKGVKPELYALSSLMFLAVLILLVIINKRSEKEVREQTYSVSRFGKWKKIVSVVLVAAIIGSVIGFGWSTNRKANNELVVFNFATYMAPEVKEMFEKETGYKIRYDEFTTNEEMYAKYKAGAANYDLICASDYMIQKLASEGELKELDLSNIPNYKNLNEDYLEISRAFDPELKYSIPHFVGTVGILYDTKKVSAEKAKSWNILWDEEYKGQIIMPDSLRDVFLPPLKLLGYSINTEDRTQLIEAQKLLLEQKPLVQRYLLDEARDEIVGENAAMAVVYSGEVYFGMEDNPDLAYAVPEEGSNVWIDSWVIPKTCKNKEAAEAFLNFLCREDVAKLNFEYTYFGTPNKALQNTLDESLQNNPALFPDKAVMDKCELFASLKPETDNFYSELWKRIKAD